MTKSEPGSGKSAERDYTVRALARGLGVIKLFEFYPDGLGLTAIAQNCDLPTPTAFRIIQTLLSEQFLEETTPGVYRPSVDLVRLARSAYDSNWLVRVARPVLQSLAVQSEQTINLGVLRSERVLYLERLDGYGFVGARVSVGSTLPTECTSMGKLLLAFLEGQEAENVLSSLEYQCRGPRAIQSRSAMLAELRQIREVGFAVQDEELEHGLRSIAGPVTDRAGKVVAAVNIAVNANLVTRAELESVYAPMLLVACQKISDAGAGDYLDLERANG